MELLRIYNNEFLIWLFTFAAIDIEPFVFDLACHL